MFSRLANPRLRLLPLLWVFWLVMGGLLLLVLNRIMLWRLDLKNIGILLLYVSPIAVVLGCAHYAVLRLRLNRDERIVSRRELWLVPALAITMSVIFGWLVWQKIRQDRLLADIRGISEDSVESAVAFVGGDARTTGEEPFELRQKAAITQREALLRWAKNRDLITSPEIWCGKAMIGASEHDVWQENGEYWKVTRPDHFGWTVLPGDNGFPEFLFL